MKTNNPLRDKLDDDTLDLSLSQMNEVTEDVVRDIVSRSDESVLTQCRILIDFFTFQSLLPKGTNLDLSNNLLLALPVRQENCNLILEISKMMEHV